MKQIEVIQYPVDLIDPSPYQVRERFDAESLAELAESLKARGVIQPLTARESPGDGSRLELVAGERRLRASKMAGLQTVPVIVYDLDDRAAQEIVLIENLQREDLTVSEEARGYRKALDLRDAEGKPIYTQESLARKIGKPLTHVTDRLKMLQCPSVLVAAVESKQVAISTAMLVGRIPDEKEREKAAKRVLKPEIQEVPLNFEQTRELIRSEFMVSLQKPGFDKEDADLLPVVMEGEVRVMGGSCLDCPFLADSQSETPARNSEVGHGARGVGAHQMCTLPTCFKKKQDAAWKIIARSAEEQNVRVIAGDAARKLFGGHRGGLVYDSDYIQLDDTPNYDDIGKISYDNKKTWKQLLKGAAFDVVVARHPVTGLRVELVEKKQAVLIAKAKLKGTEVKAEGEDEEKAANLLKEQRAQEIRAQKMEVLLINEGLSDLVAAITRKGMDLDNLDFLFQMALGQSGADGMRSMRQWLEVTMPKGTVNSEHDYEEEILKAVRARATGVNGWLGFLVAAILCKHIKYSGSEGEDFVELKKRYGIKDAELKRRAAAILDAGKKEKKVPGAAVDEKVINYRNVDQYCCDVCTCRVGVGIGMGKTAATTPFGEMKCEMCGGKWQSIWKYTKSNGLSFEYMDFREQVRGIVRGEITYLDVLGHPPKAGTAAHSEYEVKRIALANEVDRKPGEERVNVGPETTFEEQVKQIAEGAAKPSDFIGAKPDPKKDAEGYKAWNAARMKLVRAAGKLK